MNNYMEKRNEKGFTLIELLIAIVVVGILAAVAIVGIAGLTNTGSKAACTTSADSAKAASAAYYANQTPNAWPTTFQSMATQSATNSPPVFEVPASSSWTDSNHLKGNGWTLAMTGGGATEPTFVVPCGP
ncbi:MAG: type II secretion system GspH family protein [Actinomycetota bacterium]|nr:type II secretion system GspH family protein [Actinomycetota bacterium]